MILLLISVSVWSADDKSLVLYYPLDGDTKDSSENDNHGEIQGKSKWVNGKFGAKAVDLEPNAWIGITPSDSLNGDIFMEEFSLSAWIKPNFEGSAWEHIWRSLPAGGSGHNTLIYKQGFRAYLLAGDGWWWLDSYVSDRWRVN